MIEEQVLKRDPRVLDRRARERYFEDGFLTVPGYIGAAWLERLRSVVAAKVEASRALSASDDQFDLAPGHCAEKPNIRRLRKAVDQHPELWAFAQDPVVVDLVADLLGPDLRFHSSKLNFKWSDGGDAVHWHQDIQAWPHTSFSVLTFGVYLDDTSAEQGPLTALPGTHRGPLFDQFDDGGRWTGALSARDVATLPTDRAVDMCGPAGTVVLIHCRVVHGSPSTTRRAFVRCSSTCTPRLTRCRSRRRRRQPRERACWCEARSPCTSTWSHIRRACHRAGTRSAIVRSSPLRVRQDR